MATKIRKNRDDFYATWKEAAAAIQRMDPPPRNVEEYRIRRVPEDPRLPNNPHTCFVDFPGWETFLGRDKK